MNRALLAKNNKLGELGLGVTYTHYHERMVNNETFPLALTFEALGAEICRSRRCVEDDHFERRF